MPILGRIVGIHLVGSVFNFLSSAFITLYDPQVSWVDYVTVHFAAILCIELFCFFSRTDCEQHFIQDRMRLQLSISYT